MLLPRHLGSRSCVAEKAETIRVASSVTSDVVSLISRKLNSSIPVIWRRVSPISSSRGKGINWKLDFNFLVSLLPCFVKIALCWTNPEETKDTNSYQPRVYADKQTIRPSAEPDQRILAHLRDVTLWPSDNYVYSHLTVTDSLPHVYSPKSEQLAATSYVLFVMVMFFVSFPLNCSGSVSHRNLTISPASTVTLELPLTVKRAGTRNEGWVRLCWC